MTTLALEGARRVVVAVMAAEIARARLAGVVLASPPAGESDMLRRWLSQLGPVRTPDPGAVADLAGALAAAGAPARAVEPMAWRAAAEAMGAAEDLLPVGSTNKTQLLLEPSPLPARVLPLGDIWASALAGEIGHPALPPVLAHASHAQVAQAEGALADYLVGGVAPEEAFRRLGGLAQAVRDALDGAEWRRRGLVVPKVAPWTVGIDLAR